MSCRCTSKNQLQKGMAPKSAGTSADLQCTRLRTTFQPSSSLHKPGNVDATVGFPIKTQLLTSFTFMAAERFI